MIRLIRLIKNSFSDFIDSLYAKPPESELVLHCGKEGNCKKIRFTNILIIDDLSKYVTQSLDVIKGYYTKGEVNIYLTYTYRSALTIFKQNHFDLVILDFDLQDDEGNGSRLIQKFLIHNPSTIVLANSHNNKYNEQLLAQGAVRSLKKKRHLLRQWLEQNDPITQ